MKRQGWFNERDKRLHQSRICSQLKTDLSFLSIITGRTISDLTEQSISNYLDSNRDKIKDYHQKQSRGYR